MVIVLGLALELCTKYCSKCYRYIILLNFHSTPVRLHTIILTVQMWKLRHGYDKNLAEFPQTVSARAKIWLFNETPLISVVLSAGCAVP